MARANGPYFMPARYLVDGRAAEEAGDGGRRERVDVPRHLIGPTWRGDWAVGGRALVDGAAALLGHTGFADAASAMFGGAVVVPEQVFVNLTTPSSGQGFSHTDIPEFSEDGKSFTLTYDEPQADWEIALDQVEALAAGFADWPRLRLRGLMAIPRADSDDHNRAAFHALAMTLSQLRNTMPALDTLSMGMSADYTVAIEEGATLVRLGTALFGPRPPKDTR